MKIGPQMAYTAHSKRLRLEGNLRVFFMKYIKTLTIATALVLLLAAAGADDERTGEPYNR